MDVVKGEFPRRGDPFRLPRGRSHFFLEPFAELNDQNEEMPMRAADDIDDEWLVFRAQDGDAAAAALAEIVDRWQPKLWRHGLRLTGTTDSTQLAWVAIIRGLHRLSDPACFRRWAYRIVGNKGADHVRARQWDRRHTNSLTEDPVDPRVEEAPEQDEIALLHSAMGRLSPEHRTILSLFYLEEMTLAEIADAVDAPVGTVESRLHDARNRLKQSLERNES